MVNGDAPKNEVDEDTSRWRIVQRNYFLQSRAKANCASFHADSNLLIVGFSNGLFGLYELPEFTMIHTLRFLHLQSISRRKTLMWCS